MLKTSMEIISKEFEKVKQGRDLGLKSRKDFNIPEGQVSIYSMGENNPTIRIDIKSTK